MLVAVNDSSLQQLIHWRKIYPTVPLNTGLLLQQEVNFQKYTAASIERKSWIEYQNTAVYQGSISYTTKREGGGRITLTYRHQNKVTCRLCEEIGEGVWQGEATLFPFYIGTTQESSQTVVRVVTFMKDLGVTSFMCHFTQYDPCVTNDLARACRDGCRSDESGRGREKSVFK